MFIAIKARDSVLTYACIVVSDVEKIPTARAVIASPGVLAATFRALAGFLLFAFINVYRVKDIQIIENQP